MAHFDNHKVMRTKHKIWVIFDELRMLTSVNLMSNLAAEASMADFQSTTTRQS